MNDKETFYPAGRTIVAHEPNERIAAALERIADSLEKISARLDSWDWDGNSGISAKTTSA